MFELVRTARTIRTFKDERLPEPVIYQILEAGRLSGSAKNIQSWHFIAVQQRDTLLTLSKCGRYASHLAGAALAVALVTDDPFQRLTVPFDLGRAAQNMILTAWSLGVGSAMATIYQSDKAREALGVPITHIVLWCISFGYPAESQDRPPRKGGRHSSDEVIHKEKW